jgi:hypothetical protein
MFMKARIIITVIWLVSILLMVFAIELYTLRTEPLGKDKEEVPYLLPEGRLEVLKPLCAFYSIYLGGIILFWYTRPFKSARTDNAERMRFWLAIACTLILNIIMLFYVWHIHIFGYHQVSVLENARTGIKLFGFLSFLVAPVNFYYFGMKPV